MLVITTMQGQDITKGIMGKGVDTIEVDTIVVDTIEDQYHSMTGKEEGATDHQSIPKTNDHAQHIPVELLYTEKWCEAAP